MGKLGKSQIHALRSTATSAMMIVIAFAGMAFLPLLASACGDLLGAEDIPDPDPDASTTSDAPVGGEGSVDSAPSPDAPPVVCRAPGPPVLDPAFGTKDLPGLSLPVTTVDAMGRIVSIGRSNCGDAGEQKLLMLRHLQNGTPDGSFCFGGFETPRSIIPTSSGGYLFASLVSGGTSKARVRVLDYQGAETLTATSSQNTNTMPTFALEVSPGKYAWGGYLYPSLNPHSGFVGTVSANFLNMGPPLPDSKAVSAAVEGPNLYVAFITEPAAGPAEASELILKRYTIPNNALIEDVAYSSNPLTRFKLNPGTGISDSNGITSMIVRKEVVTIAMLVANAATVYTFDNKEWKTLKQLTGSSANAPITTACDDVVMIGHGGPVRFSRLEPDGLLSLPLTDPNASITSLARHPSGSVVLLLQSNKLLRTLP